MDVRDLIVRTYQDFIRSAPMNSELRRSLRSHERVPAFVDNLAREFRTKKGLKLSKDQVREATVDMTRIFIRCVETRANERRMSDLEKMVIKEEANRKKEMTDLVDALDKTGETNVTEEKPGTETETQTAVID